MAQPNDNGGVAEPGAPDADGFIVDPRESDVLCGRGGAALRHPGNQTYRRLVNLNKGLYITCLKTEKLKISRSIVAAIREQNGRFLEKDAKRNAWYDIGDKKAIEKTSQALREGQPKLKQQMAEMEAVGIPPGNYEIVNEGNIPQQQQFMQQQQQNDQVLMPPPLTEQELQREQMLRQQQMIRQQLMQQRGNSGQHITDTFLSGDHSESRRQAHDTETMRPPPPPQISTGSRQQDFHTEMLQRLSLLDMDQRISMSSMGSNNSSGQLNFQQQQRNRMRPGLSMRSSLAQDLGIDESQLSLMSEYSAFGGSITSMGRGPLQQQSSNNSMGMNPLPGLGLTPTNNICDSQGLMSVDSSFRRALMGMPLGSINTMASVTSDQLSFDQSMSAGGAMSALSMGGDFSADGNTANYQNANLHQQQQLQQQIEASRAAVAAAAATTAASSALPDPIDPQKQQLDRRRVFAKMKYNRPPSFRATAAPEKAQQAFPQQTASATTLTMDDMSDYHFLESNMSLQSGFSNVTGLDSKPAAAPTVKTEDGDNDNNAHNNDSHGPARAPMTTKVVVEVAKVIDHSSESRRNMYSEVMSTGSRHSLMSGLSRISDTSIDQSIFSDLSHKIGNISTSSVAMSDMSLMDLHDRDSPFDSKSNGSSRSIDFGL